VNSRHVRVPHLSEGEQGEGGKEDEDAANNAAVSFAILLLGSGGFDGAADAGDH